MGDAKQVQLNSTYNGPSIHPDTYHRPGRGRGCAGRCCCCLLSLLWKIFLTIVIIVGIATLVLWLVFRPNRFKFHVDDASLTQFNLTTTTNNSMLHYNLAVNMSLRNPNKRISVYYDLIEARAFYEDRRFSVVTLQPFYQGHKNTSTLNPTFVGSQLVLFGAEDLQEFNQDKLSGVYNIEMKLYLRVRFKFGKLKTHKLKPRVACDLKVPLKSADGNTIGRNFQRTRCDLDYSMF